MNIKYFGAVALFLVAGAVFPHQARAALSFGGGVYTNLCGTGTQATAYRCTADCNPETGTCTAENEGAVRYVCLGNWNQCLENESGWGNGVSLGNPGCGNTVQLSVYDKKCRKEDGSWDFSCKLLGYMVWYSGACRTGVTPLPTVSVAVSKFSSPTPSLALSPKPTLISSQPQSKCDSLCQINSDCSQGLTCIDGVCRNKDCPADKTCFCQGEGQVKASATASGKLQSPETGFSAWIWVLGAVVLGWAGYKIIRLGRVLWS